MDHMNRIVREGYSGTGPGPITPDGCAVELYERIPLGNEVDVVQGAVRAGARILELGCGVGRMTGPLVQRGFEVTAVDESPEMLERVATIGVRTVHSPIELLDLDERFDVVLLASFLVHAADPSVQRGLLSTCRKHVADDGCVLIQRQSGDWRERIPREAQLGDGRVRIVSAVPVSDSGEVLSVHVDYQFPDAHWTQTYLARPMTTPEFEQVLADAGLRVDSYLTPDGMWVRAVPGDGNQPEP
jgi:SAM-dependent methyltransferase